MKAKNIKQTELVADLREAILRVARHFQCTDPKNCNVVSLCAPAVGAGLDRAALPGLESSGLSAAPWQGADPGL